MSPERHTPDTAPFSPLPFEEALVVAYASKASRDRAAEYRERATSTEKNRIIRYLMTHTDRAIAKESDAQADIRDRQVINGIEQYKNLKAHDTAQDVYATVIQRATQLGEYDLIAELSDDLNRDPLAAYQHAHERTEKPRDFVAQLTEKLAIARSLQGKAQLVQAVSKNQNIDSFNPLMGIVAPGRQGEAPTDVQAVVRACKLLGVNLNQQLLAQEQARPAARFGQRQKTVGFQRTEEAGSRIDISVIHYSAREIGMPEGDVHYEGDSLSFVIEKSPVARP